MLLVGTHVDQRANATLVEALKSQNQEPVSAEAGSKRASELGAVGYVECSSLTQVGVNAVIDKAVRHALRYKRRLLKRDSVGCVGCNIM